MKKFTKISLITAFIIGGATLAYAKLQKDTAWMCTPGSTGNCMPDFFSAGNYECLVPPGSIDWGDCGGTVQVVIPN